MSENAATASAPRAPSSKRLEPLRQVDAGVLNIAYHEAGPADGPLVIPLHGSPEFAYGWRRQVGPLAAVLARLGAS